MRYYADNEIDGDRLIALPAAGAGDTAAVEGSRYRHVGMTIHGEPVYVRVSDLEERDVPHDRA